MSVILGLAGLMMLALAVAAWMRGRIELAVLCFILSIITFIVAT